MHSGLNEGYGKLADVFRANTCGGCEVGAAVVVYRDGTRPPRHHEIIES